MKIMFRGWRREVVPHNRTAQPVVRGGGKYTQGKSGDPLVWDSANRTYARLEKLALNGSFLLQIDFDDADLRNWLKKFVAEKPEDALRLIGEMQVEALLALSGRGEPD